MLLMNNNWFTKRGSFTPLYFSQYLEPDYGSPSEDDDEDDDDDDFEVDYEDDFKTDTFLDQQIKNSGSMSSSSDSRWGSPSPQSSWGSWGDQQRSSWGWNDNNQQRSGWGWNDNNQQQRSWGWGSSNQWSSPSQKIEINRSKRIVICDFLDCLIETYQSNGNPGLFPRGPYDARPRFEVWNRLMAFNPERYIIIVPREFLTQEGKSLEERIGWKKLVDYITYCFADYTRMNIDNCQITVHPLRSLDKHSAIYRSILHVDKKDVVYVGVYSGQPGQSDQDLVAAKKAGIDFVGLTDLLNNMY